MKSPLLRHSAPGSLTVIPLGIILCFSQIPEGRAEASVEESRIEAVTVYPRGARVTRNLTLTLEPGSNTIELPGLPVEVDPSSLRLADGPDWLSITSVESRHRLLDEAPDAPSRELLARIESLKQQRREQEHAQQSAAKQLALLDAVISQAARASASEEPSARTDAGHWRQMLALIGEESAAALSRQRAAEQRLRDIDRALRLAEAELEGLSRQPEEILAVTLTLESSGAGEAEFGLVYQVPSAAWRPLYDMRLDSEAAEVTISQLAEVRQSSGEDWTGAAVTLSTARPDQGRALPEPQSWFLDAGHLRGSVTSYKNELMEPSLPQAMRSLSDEEMDFAAGAVPARERLQVLAGEFAAEYRVPGRVSLPADGSAHKLRLEEHSNPVTLSVKAFPKVSRQAHLMGVFTYQGEAPLLPGQVALFRDEAFIGHSVLPLLRPGEERELDFGADDRVAIDYRFIEGEKGETGLIAQRFEEQRAYDIEITNHHKRPIEILVFDQLPVPLHEDIRVTLLDETTRPSEEDFEGRKGVLVWRASYGPGEARSIRLAYKVSYPEGMQVTGF